MMFFGSAGFICKHRRALPSASGLGLARNARRFGSQLSCNAPIQLLKGGVRSKEARSISARDFLGARWGDFR